jgi:hypothetical protein
MEKIDHIKILLKHRNENISNDSEAITSYDIAKRLEFFGILDLFGLSNLF